MDNEVITQGVINFSEMAMLTPNLLAELVSQGNIYVNKLIEKREFEKIDKKIRNKAKFASMPYKEQTKRDYYHQGYMLAPEYSTLYNALYINHKKKEVMYSIRGTDFSNTRDIVSDLSILNKSQKFNERFIEEKGRVKQIIDAYKDDYKIHLSGHSLGGKIIVNLMGDSSISNHIETGHAFNPGQVSTELLAEELIDPGESLQVHLMDTDPVSQGYGYLRKPIGEIHHHQNTNYTYDSAHYIDSFIEE